MNITKIKEAIAEGYFDKAFLELYGNGADLAKMLEDLNKIEG